MTVTMTMTMQEKQGTMPLLNSISLSSLFLKNCAALEVKVFLVFCFSELISGVGKLEDLNSNIIFFYCLKAT